MPHLLGISGALRADSTNTKLVHEARRLFAPERFTFADLRLPLYDGDLEAEGIPPEVTRLAGQVKAADAVVISTPEYNKAPPGVLKNALDWLSRVPRPWPTVGKPVAVMSAAAGKAGGERSQYILILMLVAFQAKLIVTPEVSIPSSARQFDDDGRLTNERALQALEKQMAALKAAIGTGPQAGIVSG